MSQSNQKVVVENFGLSRSIRKRINDLVNLQLTPTTISLFTAEFSKMDEDVKIAIGQFIAALLEVENEALQDHFDSLKEINSFGNSRDHLIMEQRKNNLQRIQQVFIKGLAEKESLKLKQEAIKDNGLHSDITGLDYKKIMVTNSNQPSVEQINKAINLEIAKIRRNNELFELEVSQLKKSINDAKTGQDEKRVRHLEGRFILTKQEFSERNDEYLFEYNKLKEKQANFYYAEAIKNNQDTSWYKNVMKKTQKALNPKSKIPNEVLEDHTIDIDPSLVQFKDISRLDKEKFFLNIIKEAEEMNVTLEQAAEVNDPFLMLIAQDTVESGDDLSKKVSNKSGLKKTSKK